MRKSPRLRRLLADYDGICQLRDQSTILEFESSGEPPQKYRLKFSGTGIWRGPGNRIKLSDRHECLIEFGAAYPRLVPNLAWQTPIFHPNISNNGVVCLGGYGTHWAPSLTLAELCSMLWDMIRFKNYDTESPYNREAAIWAKSQTDFVFPIDSRSIKDKISNPDATQNGVEIIEHGIEVVSPNPKPKPPDDHGGIIFLD